MSEKWTPLSRVLGYRFGNGPGDGGAIVYDQAWAPVPAIVDGKKPDWKKLSLGPQSIGFSMEKGGRALIIGGGGGRDISNALTSGIGDVDVIEINAAIRDIVDNQLGSFSGSPYKLPHVNTAIGDGARGARRPRHEVRRDPHRVHRHVERRLRAGLRAHREQPVHQGSVQRVLRPHGRRRCPQRQPPPPAHRTRSRAHDRARAGRAGAPWRQGSGAQHRGAARHRRARLGVRDRARAPPAVDRRRARER